MSELMNRFQFTPLREGRHYKAFTQWAFSNFNSRPSARGDWRFEAETRTQTISIHAPPRGATCAIILSGDNANFNSRPSARGDWISDFFVRGDAISIHAPPRGATLYAEGADPNEDVFQFTPLREGRQAPAPAPAPAQTQAFQFTPLREGRQRALARLLRRTIFQFTPLREGRRNVSCNRNWKLYFNSRPSARGDCCFQIGKPGIDNFNSRPSARGDHLRSGQSCLP